MRVLLIEQADIMAAAFTSVIRAQQHRCTHLTAVKSLRPLIGLSTAKQEVDLDRRFHVALVDSLISEEFDGAQVVKALTAAGIPCLGNSALPDPNTAMREAGATLVMSKGAMLGALYYGKFPLEAALPLSFAQRKTLIEFEARWRRDCHLRKPIDELVHSLLAQTAQ